MLRTKRWLINHADTVKKIKTNFDSFSEMLQWSACLNTMFSSLWGSKSYIRKQETIPRVLLFCLNRLQCRCPWSVISKTYSCSSRYPFHSADQGIDYANKFSLISFTASTFSKCQEAKQKHTVSWFSKIYYKEGRSIKYTTCLKTSQWCVASEPV